MTMNRVTIELPETFSFETQLRLRVDDLNYGGHLANESVLILAHEARLRFLEEHDLSERNAAGASLIMVDAAVQYETEGYRGEMIQVAVEPDGFSRVGFDLYYRMTKEDGNRLASAKTGMVCYSYKNEEVLTMPDPLREKLS